jgi:hypothetical protein
LGRFPAIAPRGGDAGAAASQRCGVCYAPGHVDAQCPWRELAPTACPHCGLMLPQSQLREGAHIVRGPDGRETCSKRPLLDLARRTHEELAERQAKDPRGAPPSEAPPPPPPSSPTAALLAAASSGMLDSERKTSDESLMPLLDLPPQVSEEPLQITHVTDERSLVPLAPPAHDRFECPKCRAIFHDAALLVVHIETCDSVSNINSLD